MNPTALKLGADMVASDPTLQVDGGIGLLVIAACAILVVALIWYASGYERSEDT